MLSLKDALNRIFHWFQENHPIATSSLAVGLSPLEIDAALGSLPFQLPQEVRDLYEWSNGLDEEIFDYKCLLSLESAIQQAKNWLEEPYEEIAEMYRYTGKAIFPIFQIEGDFLAVVETNNERDPSPIVHLSQAGGTEISLKYANLTAMLLTIAESYETGGFFIGRDGYVEQDEKKYAAAYRNHNSGIGELALNRFLDRLSVDSDSKPIQVLHGDLCLINAYGIEIPSSPLKSEVVNTLSNLLEDEQSDSGFTVVLALEELRAVDALIQGLKHPGKWVRSRAAFTLGKIKAIEAVEFVSQLLEDPDPIVQEAVHEALEMLRSER